MYDLYYKQPEDILAELNLHGDIRLEFKDSVWRLKYITKINDLECTVEKTGKNLQIILENCALAMNKFS